MKDNISESCGEMRINTVVLLIFAFGQMSRTLWKIEDNLIFFLLEQVFISDGQYYRVEKWVRASEKLYRQADEQ